MKLDSPEFKALFTPEMERLADMFKRRGHEIRIAGGSVRDLLMDIKPADVDFATIATPTQMKEMFEAETIRMLNKKGEEHGTITCRINDKENFEVTTLRIDVVCDGRRAEVKFTTDWMKDAYRRDLTVNSLFLGLDGTVYDYTNGIEDIKKRRVAFVGDPVVRLEEDYLRILRYFRFFGRIAKSPTEHEEKTIEAIIKCRDGLKNISGERLWMELHKILVGRFAASVMEVMLTKCGLNSYLALPPDANVAEFQRVAEANINPETEKVDAEPSTVLSALFNDASQAQEFQRRMRCSNNERFLIEFIVQHRDQAFANKDDIMFFKLIILDEIFAGNNDVKEFARLRCIELLKYINTKAHIPLIREWEIDVFPVHGKMLIDAGVKKGPIIRNVMKYLFELWKKSNLTATADELLTHCNDDFEIEPEDRSRKPKSQRKRTHS
ncbi:poly A polymerase head domain-containing protein [Ditylenchus destructor]|nr:poly A polymerase head domain-containing protein [Ditylenchus destructor]